MISKELLSEVLGCDCSECYFEDTYNLINYKYQYDVTWSEETQYNNSSINIYELAHKCKEWAESKGYITLTFGDMVYIVKDTFDEESFNFYEHDAYNNVFKAYQYILGDMK